MKNLFLSSLLVFNLLIISYLAQAQNIETRQLAAFSKLDLQGAADVVLIQGGSESAKIEAENVPLDHIYTEVRNQTLFISLKKRKNYENLKLKIYLTFRQLNAISSSGAFNLTTESTIKASDFLVDFSGAGNVDLKINAKNLKLHSSGAGNMEVSGKADFQKIVLSGAGNVQAFDLMSQTSEVELNGVGNVELNVSNQFTAELNGMGSIRYKCNPTSKNISKNGLGSIKSVN
jgi:Putative auto-transporter adhesin, head GIN domain